MKRRVIALVAALLLAGVGTFVLVNFVQGASDRAAAGQQLAEVYVIQQTIPEGTAGEDVQQFVRKAEVLVDTLSPDAVVNLSELSGFVAEVDLFVNDQLTRSRWITPEEFTQDFGPVLESNVRIEVPEGHMTLPVNLSAEQALAGTVVAGDTVAVVAYFGGFPTETDGTETIEVGDDVVAIPESANEGGKVEAAAHIMLNNVLVVEVLATSPPNFATTQDFDGTVTNTPLLAPTGNFVVTFALEPEDVERMVFLANEGQIWLALQTPDDTGPTSIITIDDVFKD